MDFSLRLGSLFKNWIMCKISSLTFILKNREKGSVHIMNMTDTAVNKKAQKSTESDVVAAECGIYRKENQLIIREVCAILWQIIISCFEV